MNFLERKVPLSLVGNIFAGAWITSHSYFSDSSKSIVCSFTASPCWIDAPQFFLMKQEEGWYRIARLGRLHYESAHRRNRKLSLVLFYPCMLHLLCCAQCASAFSSRFRSSFVGAHFPFLFPALYLCEIASSIRCYVINPIKDNRLACLSAIAEIRKHENTERGNSRATGGVNDT